VVFDRVMSFRGKSGNRPLVLRGDDGLAALTAFQQVLGEAMMKAGLWRWAKPNYTPHVTQLYADRGIAEQVVERVGWTVREFVLVRSLLGQTRYIPLARWPLRG
jgi:RNA 2',3'-cyclic 3'-phosphodiesterase